MSENLALQKIAPLIHEIRGERVILDSDLARIYGVTTKRLNEQVRRNLERFPEDFAFQVSTNELGSLRSQIATSKGRGGRRYLPYAFTEHGAIMAATVLNSKAAVEMSVFVVRAFVKLRQTLLGHRELASKIDELDRKVGTHDKAIASIIAAIRQLTMVKPSAIGFRVKRKADEHRRNRSLRPHTQGKSEVSLPEPNASTAYRLLPTAHCLLLYDVPNS